MLVQLQPGDPLFNNAIGAFNAIPLTRGTLRPGTHETTNAVTPPVDLSQVYSSHASHQAFLRDYIFDATGPHATGRMLESISLVDGSHHLPTWKDVKANALKLGILLTDADVGSVPLLATDDYGKLTLLNGRVQMAVFDNGVSGASHFISAGTALAPITTAGAVGAGVQFINDKLVTATQSLDAHYAAGDGRANENIGLTAIHDIFLHEHNRMLQQTKDYIQAQLDKGDTSFASDWVLPGTNLAAVGGVAHVITAAEWNGERLFQAARYTTETQYQHLVFEEFARKVAPDIHLSGDTNIHLNPAILAEFAHTVYRFGHSMLDENLHRYSIHHGVAGDPLNGTYERDAAGNPILLNNGTSTSTDIALLTAFTNPNAYAARGADAAGELALGSIHQVANEIDEFVTGTLRNNLLGQALDLAAINIARARSEGIEGLNLVRKEIFDQNHDTALKPYDSWHEFGQFLKHPESLINFVAAYGTHASLHNGAGGPRDMTPAQLRDAATALVTAGENEANKGSDAYNFMHGLGAWAHALPGVEDSRLAHGVTLKPDGTPQTVNGLVGGPPILHIAANSTGDITGLDHVDLWIGGLAEKQNLHGGLLGTTFDLIFKLQMETLQDADRLYYLPRIEGTHFSDQIEGNSFAELIMNATGIKHLPASIFLTPEFTIEAADFYNTAGAFDQTKIDAFNTAHGGAHLLEITNDGALHFLGNDNFFGNTMVLGGTAGNDHLMAGQADDDTVYGDAGNDIIDGGGGNDNLFGGDGNDILSNTNSSIGTVFHGDGGDDTIYGSKGFDTITGGDGNDLIYGNQGDDGIVAGAGNDIVFGGEGADDIQGNQGDDWLDGGADGGDNLTGDVGAPSGQFPLYGGDDVLIGHVGTTMKGFSGDDIMVGTGGFTKFIGGLGFDWASFEIAVQGVDADMNRREFVPTDPTGGDGVRDIYAQTEALSGSKFDDFIVGDNNARINALLDKNRLDNPGLIKGLADGAVNNAGNPILRTVNGTTEGAFFTPGQPTGTGGNGFSGGNILLGGAGNDIIKGGGGSDVIDGDAWLHVELLPNAQGVVGLGSQILREIRYDETANNVDTAVFTGNLATYTISGPDAQGFITVTDTAGTDGADRIRNIERLQFADVTVAIDKNGIIYDDTAAPAVVPGGITINHVPIGAVTVATPGTATPGTPEVGKALTATVALQDFDFGPVRGGPAGVITNLDGTVPAGGAISDRFHFQWQFLDIASGQWISIDDPHNANPLLPTNGATSATFTPTGFFLGEQLRVATSFTDPLGFTERVFSAPTAVLAVNPLAANTAPFIVQQQELVGLPNTSAQHDQAINNMFLPLSQVFSDRETASTALTYTAAIITADGVAHTITGNGALGVPNAFQGLHFTALPIDANGNLMGQITGTPPAGFAGGITVRITATDAGLLAVTNDFKINVLGDAGNNAPVFGSAPVIASVLENVAAGTAVNPLEAVKTPAGTPVATLSATDALTSAQITNGNAPTPLTWTITSDAVTKEWFAFGGATNTPVGSTAMNSTNSLVFLKAPDFELIRQELGLPGASGTLSADGKSITFDVAVQVSDGVLTSTQHEFITITNVNESLTGALSVSVRSTTNTSAMLHSVDSLADPDLITAANLSGAVPPQWQSWNVSGNGGWTNLATTMDVTASNQTVRLTANDTDVFGSTLITTPEVFVVGNNAPNTFLGDVAAGLFANGIHNRTFLGLGGTDTVSYATDTAGVKIDLVTNANNTGIAAGDKYIGVENFTGGSGNDTFVATNDGTAHVLNGGAGIDTLDLSAVGAQLVVSINALSSGIVTGSGGFRTDTLLGIENFTGGQGRNTITVVATDTTAHVLKGGALQDTITGGANSADTIVATVDNFQDQYDGGTAAGVVAQPADTADYAAYTTGLTVNLGVINARVLGSGLTTATSDTLRNFENFIGGSGADNIIGSAAANKLAGGDGNDTLTGGAGNDILTGGAGADVFVFNTGTGTDHITDFVATGAAHDFVDISVVLAVDFAHVKQTVVGTGVNAEVVLSFTGSTDTIHIDHQAAALAASDFAFH